jgi:transcriptional regulator of nitric oxide reductase
MSIMRRLEWERGVTGRELAEKWGISIDESARISAEASRRVAAEVTNKDHVTATVGATIETVMREALAETRSPAMIQGKGDAPAFQESPNGARRVVIEAAKTWAVLAGANAADRLPAGWDQLTDEEKRERIEQAERRIEAAKASLGMMPALPGKGET